MSPAAQFLQAMLVGLSIAAPVGPIGLLVIQRSLQHGRLVGLATGLGAAVADAIYGAIGAYGVSALIHALQGARVPLAVVGGGFLLWMAWRTWPVPGRMGGPVQQARIDAPPALLPSFVGTLLLTLSNPATVLSFVAIFGAMGARLDIPSPGLMVLGVLVGSALWWLVLSAAVAALRSRFDARARRGVARVSALMLGGFALWQWGSLWST